MKFNIFDIYYYLLLTSKFGKNRKIQTLYTKTHVNLPLVLIIISILCDVCAKAKEIITLLKS